MPRCSKRQASRLTLSRKRVASWTQPGAQIAELEQVSLERVGADVAHDTLVSLQQENEAAVAALAAASHKLDAANVQLAELDGLRAERARAGERMEMLEARTQELQDELANRAARDR